MRRLGPTGVLTRVPGWVIHVLALAVLLSVYALTTPVLFAYADRTLDSDELT